ncbi:hypothetical protein [Streptomyces sp. NPDC047108]|uniref:hypothetical protein n=1 Tax=Streptomyces sp. NPDC047108 TaxID=3155025 RepID=UPI0033F8A324
MARAAGAAAGAFDAAADRPVVFFAGAAAPVLFAAGLRAPGAAFFAGAVFLVCAAFPAGADFFAVALRVAGCSVLDVPVAVFPSADSAAGAIFSAVPAAEVRFVVFLAVALVVFAAVFFAVFLAAFFAAGSRAAVFFAAGFPALFPPSSDFTARPVLFAALLPVPEVPGAVPPVGVTCSGPVVCGPDRSSGAALRAVVFFAAVVAAVFFAGAFLAAVFFGGAVLAAAACAFFSGVVFATRAVVVTVLFLADDFLDAAPGDPADADFCTADFFATMIAAPSHM